MRTLLLLVLLAESGLFVSAYLNGLEECSTCQIVVGEVANGRLSKEVTCRSLQKDSVETGRLCRHIFNEIEEKDLYDDIHANVKPPVFALRDDGIPKLVHFCRTRLSYCSTLRMIWKDLFG
ncbi:hypothetical protein Aduo_003694 [Ancylostoma duodenale]